MVRQRGLPQWLPLPASPRPPTHLLEVPPPRLLLVQGQVALAVVVQAVVQVAVQEVAVQVVV